MQRLFTVLIPLLILGFAGAYIWAIANGDATVVTAATAILVFAASEFFTRRRISQQYRWDKIAPDYEAFIRLVRSEAKGKSADELVEENKQTLEDFNDHLMLWGSPDVIEAWTQALRLAETNPEDPRGIVLAYARVLLAIRKDLGHSDYTLEARDLLRITITDIDEHLPKGTAP